MLLPGFSGRMLGWSVLGIAVGLGVGWATGSNARRRNGALGGVVGGALGGLFIKLVTQFLSAGVRARHRDHHLGRADRLLHRTGQRAAQARMADGGAQPEPQRARRPRVSARQAGHDHRTRRGMRRGLVRRPERARPSCDHPARRKELFDRADQRRSGAGESPAGRGPSRLLRNGDRIEVGGTLFLYRERAQAAQG